MLVAKQRIACVAFLVLTVSACAASRKEAAPSQEPAGAQAQSPQGYPSQDVSSTKKSEPPPAPPPPPAAGSAPSQTAPSTNATGSGDYAKPPNRAAAMSQASGEIESSQRELDVAGGDCRNACRALGSMDRAAGRLCGLAQSTDEVKKCEGAKTRVLSARDKVRNTCGTCPDVSVDRNAPVPSR